MSEQVASVATGRAARAELAPVWLATPRSRLDRLWTALRFGVDTLSLLAAVALSGVAGAEGLGAGWAVLTVVLCLAAFAASGLYVPRKRLSASDEIRRVLAASALACMAVAGAALLDPHRTGGAETAIVNWLVAGTLLSVARVGVAAGQRAARRRGWDVSRTLIVGAGKVGTRTASRLIAEPEHGLEPIGFLDKEPLLHVSDPAVAKLPVLGASWDLEQVVAVNGVDQVVIAFSTAPHEVLVDLVRRCWKLGVGVQVVPRLFEVEGTRVDVQHLGALPLVGLRATDPRGWQFAVKYALDRCIAAALIVLLSPLFAVVTASILLTMGRPVLFRQRRIGRDGRAFGMLKFRTMRGRPDESGEADAAWARFVLAGTEPSPAVAPIRAPEDRRTALGRFLRKCSIDELPQLWNVLRGDMSLIGPRPERAHYVERFASAIYRYPDRHRVKSGLTGWAQVNGLRGETSLADRIEWDNFYIENWSLWLDVKILLRTLPALLGKGGEPTASPAQAPLE